MEQKIINLADTSIQNTDLNMIIDVINNGIEIINILKDKWGRDHQFSVIFDYFPYSFRGSQISRFWNYSLSPKNNNILNENILDKYFLYED